MLSRYTKSRGKSLRRQTYKQRERDLLVLNSELVWNKPRTGTLVVPGLCAEKLDKTDKIFFVYEYM